MKIHREGRQTILLVSVLCAILISLSYVYLPLVAAIVVAIISIGFYFFILHFFRNPDRQVPVELNNSKDVISPCDGKVVVIEKVEDDEFMPGEWIQVSIFMSPLNVHVNRHPISGTIKDYKYHKGKYLVAWDPKSSLENERTTVLYETEGQYLKLRQIAGAVARRIVCYCNPGDTAVKGEELGFIKFGSRVDLLLPPDSTIHVKIDQIVSGNLDKIATLPA